MKSMVLLNKFDGFQKAVLAEGIRWCLKAHSPRFIWLASEKGLPPRRVLKKTSSLHANELQLAPIYLGSEREGTSLGVF